MMESHIKWITKSLELLDFQTRQPLEESFIIETKS
jgi:hypothetical protein